MSRPHLQSPGEVTIIPGSPQDGEMTLIQFEPLEDEDSNGSFTQRQKTYPTKRHTPRA